MTPPPQPMAPPLAGRNGGRIQSSIDALDQVADYIQNRGEKVLAKRLDVVANTLSEYTDDEQAQSILGDLETHGSPEDLKDSGITLDWIRGELDRGKSQHEIRREAMHRIKMDTPGIGMI